MAPLEIFVTEGHDRLDDGGEMAQIRASMVQQKKQGGSSGFAVCS